VKRKLIASASVFLAVILFISSCNKIDTTTLGSGLIPAVDNINTFDTTLNIISDNKLFEVDSTRMLYGDYHPLGIIENDLEFGKTTATLYSSFTPPSYRTYPFTSNRSTVVIDSVVLSLGFVNVFGDTNAIQQLEVREINKLTLFEDSAYLVNGPDFLVDNDVIGSKTVDYRTAKDTSVYKNGKDTIRLGRQVRINLDTAWARRFVNYDTTAGSPYFNDTIFKDNFKGLQVVATDASPNKNALAYINLDDNDRTRITFYCRVTNSSGAVDTIAPFFSYTNDPHASIVRRTPANNYLATVTNTTGNDELVYIQAAPGSYATLKIPELNGFGNSLIHRAELICERVPGQDDFYSPPPRMFIEAINETGDSTFTIRNDFVLTNAAPLYDVNVLGGAYSNNRYVFNLSRYIQSLVTKGFMNRTLRIHAPYNLSTYFTSPSGDVPIGDKRFFVINDPMAFGRVVLYGGGYTADPARRMRLRIIYSKI
jgi:hypothetical protein